MNVIEHLPSASHFGEAQAQDDELIASLEDEQLEPQPPSVRDFTPEVDHLARIVDRLGEVVAALSIVAGAKKAPKVRPCQRPVTAFDRRRAYAARSRRDLIRTRVAEGQARYRQLHGERG